MPGLTPSSPPNASGTVRGLVSTVAQTFAGAKTFLARIVATLGITAGANRLDLRSDLGAGASDVCSVVGSTVADASVNAAAALLEARTGIGGTEVVKLRVDKNGDIRAGALGFALFRGASASLGFFSVDDSLGVRGQFATFRWVLDGSNWTLTELNVRGNVFRISLDGLVSQRGTDSGASPGAATADRAAGINAVASGASSVTITNSLVTANSRVLVTFHGDHGAARWWVTRSAGSFTVNLSAAATANAAFSWEVSSLL